MEEGVKAAVDPTRVRSATPLEENFMMFLLFLLLYLRTAAVFIMVVEAMTKELVLLCAIVKSKSIKKRMEASRDAAKLSLILTRLL